MENLRNIIKNHLSEGIVLMDLIYNSGSDFVKVTIDSFDNITIKETSNIAKRIKNDNSILSMFPNGCRLEVTTPGIGSNLVKKFQYKKNIGRNILLEYSENDSSFVCDTFLLVDVKSEGIMLRKNKKDYFIVFENIKSAKIKISFD
jgi:ribosome maturation factor RimP